MLTRVYWITSGYVDVEVDFPEMAVNVVRDMPLELLSTRSELNPVEIIEVATGVER